MKNSYIKILVGLCKKYIKKVLGRRMNFKQFTRFYQTYIKDMDCEIPMLSFGNTESDYKELSNYYYNDKLRLSINKIFEKHLIARGYLEYFETSSD